jgi:hypothetical protein
MIEKITETNQNKSVINTSGCFYLLLCGMFVNLVDIKTDDKQSIKSIRHHFKALLLNTKFLEYFFKGLNSEESLESITLISQSIINDERWLELNSYSWLISYLAEKEFKTPKNKMSFLEPLEDFSKKIVDTICSNKQEDKVNTINIQQNEFIKMYLYDLPFAKHSIIYNIKQLADNIQFYYDIYAALLDSNVKSLIESANKLKFLNNNVSSTNNNDFLIVLQKFNFHLDILNKYIQVYFGNFQL